MENAIEDYLNHLKRHGRKESTVRHVARTLTAIEAIISKDGMSLDPEEASVETYLTVRNAPDLLESTRVTYTSVYNAYIRHATGRDLGREADVLWSHPVATTRRWIDESEFRTLWTSAEDDPRLRVILAFGAWMGMRRAEIASARWSDIHGDRIIIRGKGHGPDGKIVSALMPPAVRKALDTWRPLCPPEAETIVAALRPQKESWELTPQSIAKIVRESGERCGIDLTTHSLRRLYATELDEREVSPVQIAQLMRHSCIQTTYECYIKPNQIKLDRIAAGFGEGYRRKKPFIYLIDHQDSTS